MNQFEKLKGNVRKVLFEDQSITLSLKYDKKGQLLFASYYCDGTQGFQLDKAEITGIFDKKGKLLAEKCPFYYMSSETELSIERDVILKHQYYVDKKDSISNHVVLEVDEDDVIETISADLIDKKNNTREEFFLGFKQENLALYPKDSLMIKKILSLNAAKLCFERKDLSYLTYTKTFYENNKPIEFHSIKFSSQDVNPKMVISKLKYLTENTGFFSDGITKFRLVNGEAIMSIFDFETGSFVYDEKGNWIKCDFTQSFSGRKIKAKRAITYWD